MAPAPAHPVSPFQFKPADITRARGEIAWMMGLEDPISAAELGRMLRLGGRDPGRSVRAWESGATPISGPASLALELLMGGALPGYDADRRVIHAHKAVFAGTGYHKPTFYVTTRDDDLFVKFTSQRRDGMVARLEEFELDDMSSGHLKIVYEYQSRTPTRIVRGAS